MLSKIRIDKWLWTVRIYKSRTIATDACKKGKVVIHEKIAKPSDLIEAGSIIRIKKDKINYSFKILSLLPNRVSAALAAECYINLTPPEELNKWKEMNNSSFYLPTKNRPTKKDRRELEEFLDEIDPNETKI